MISMVKQSALDNTVKTNSGFCLKYGNYDNYIITAETELMKLFPLSQSEFLGPNYWILGTNQCIFWLEL